ncbi:MAG TPA: hypothetical protein VLU73_12890 [Methylococcaceae bacterium]|nr:hypothetical protein [Methylococcaceae bacterium]
MNVTELRALARHSGIHNPEVLHTEKQLVWAIQKARGEETCFLSDQRIKCKDIECEWRSECIKLVAEWRR